MLSAYSNQFLNQGFQYSLADNRLSELAYPEQQHQYNPHVYYDNYQYPSQYYGDNQYYGHGAANDPGVYAVPEFDSFFPPANGNQQEFDVGLLSSRLHSMALGHDRSSSVHNSPLSSNRVTPRAFSQSSSNTPLTTAGRDYGNMVLGARAPPIMQLFQGGDSRQGGSGAEVAEFAAVAAQMGFLVGTELEEVLNRSAALKTSRISNLLRHKQSFSPSSSSSSSRQQLVLGVRVPSKEHVSEIVGKEGKKIKLIRQSTGALIATPSEREEHVFLVEAVPETALRVAQMIREMADQISCHKMGGGGGTERTRSPSALVGGGTGTQRLALATMAVPQRLVGKVIGTQGSIITEVQRETGTEIRSPPKDELRAPGANAVFEIAVHECQDDGGRVDERVHRAQQLIAHLVMRVWESRAGSPDSGTLDNGSASSPRWLWPAVTPMAEHEARDAVDRLLMASKAKIVLPGTPPADDPWMTVLSPVEPPKPSLADPWTPTAFVPENPWTPPTSSDDPWTQASTLEPLWPPTCDDSAFSNLRYLWTNDDAVQPLFGTIGDGRRSQDL